MDITALETILMHYAIEPINVALIRESSDNQLFKIVAVEGNYALRRAKRTKAHTIEFEAQLIERLMSQSISTPQWIQTKSGELYVTADDGSVVILMEYLTADPVEEEHIAVYAHKAGALLASIHTATQDLTLNAVQNRTVYSELERVIAQEDFFVTTFEDGNEFVERVKYYMGAARGKGGTDCIIHNDFRPHNVLYSSNGDIYAIDFDWSCYGPAIKDFAHAAVEWSMLDGQDEPNTHIHEAIVSGYMSVRPTDFLDSDFNFWAAFSCLSDTATYICDKIFNQEELPERIRSYMYKKFKYFHGKE